MVWAAAVPLPAQNKLAERVVRVDSLMQIRYHRAKIDTAYVIRPRTRFTVSARFNMTGSRIDMEGFYEGKRLRSRTKADYKKTVSVAVNYLGLSGTLSLNPAKLLGRYRDFEASLVYYGKHYGGDLIYQDAKNYHGYLDLEDYPRMELPPNAFKMRSLNASGYFVFNHRRFSYPAAMTQGYIQRRSAGSWMLALSAQGMQGRYTDTHVSKLSITNVGVGGGYGYNYVPARRWLIHISVLPTFIVYNYSSLKYDESRVPLRYDFPEVIITTRSAVVWQVRHNQFAALSGVYYFSDNGTKSSLDIENTRWRARIAYGFRF